jgi:chromosomal replication initiator protein
MTNEELWQAVLAQIQFAVSRANFATWFKNTKIISNKNGEILISVPNSFSKEWLNNKYQSLILKILRSLDKNVRVIDFVVKSQTTPQKTKTHSHLTQITLENSQLQFKEFKVNQKTNLNPRYTFENFVVGSFNELAHAAAWAVSENPGSVYNPLFIYGGVGLGKTHLLQATGNRITTLFSNKIVKYTTSESFISSIVEAIKNREIDELKKKLRKIDVLIMDDVQFFAGKEKTQEEFFHIFNSLYQAQKQIILSSDRPPNAIPALEERLRSRFEGGMIADIGTPDLETRIAILKAKCEEKEIELSQEVLEYIASNIQRNIREMEGALNRLVVYQKLNQKIPDIQVTKKLLRNLIISPKKATTFKKIIKVVSAFYDLDEKDIILPTRRKEIVKPRQIAMYLLREELNESYPSIGRKFQGKDHTTAIYAYEKISKQLEEDDNLLTEINLIKQRLYSDF